MKKLLFVLIVFASFEIELANAQTIAPTSGAQICNCFPANWHASSDFCKVSNTFYYGNQVETWDPVLPPIPSGANTFFDIKSTQSGFNIWTKVKGLIPNKKYKFTYSVIRANTNSIVSTIDQVKFGMADAKSADSDDFEAGFWPGAVHSYVFSPDDQKGHWITKSFEFVAFKQEGILVMLTSGFGHVGLDVSQFAVEKCDAGVEQVPVAPTAQITCPATTINLVIETFQGLIPAGAQLRYFTTPDRSTLPLPTPQVGAGTYYAFFYDEDDNCYNTTYSTSKIVVTYKPCADLTPTINIAGLGFGGSTSRDFVVNLFENNGAATNGNVSFRITKLNGFNITYPTVSGTSSIYGGIANQNSNWTFTETAQFITVSSTVPVPASGKAVIGFNVKRKPGISPGLTQNMTPTILSGAGGEQNSKNNSIATSLSTN